MGTGDEAGPSDSQACCMTTPLSWRQVTIAISPSYPSRPRAASARHTRLTSLTLRLNRAVSPAEQAFYPTLFAPLSDSSGHISGQQAYAFLTLSSIPPSTLGEIWAVADPEDTGRLDVGGWTMAMRLIASVQAGGGVTTEAGEKGALVCARPLSIPPYPSALTSSRWLI